VRHKKWRGDFYTAIRTADRRTVLTHKCQGQGERRKLDCHFRPRGRGTSLCRKRLRNEKRGRGNIEDRLFRIKEAKEAPGAHLATVPALCEMHNASEPYIPLELQFPGYIRLTTYVTE
jgi:hypothetical protein